MSQDESFADQQLEEESEPIDDEEAAERDPDALTETEAGTSTDEDGKLTDKVKSYDVRARESRASRFSEEFAYQNSRKKQLSQMDKRQRHLLLFTNFDQLNFTNINKSELVKAWALLYHFRSHSTDSNLHQEFNSIV